MAAELVPLLTNAIKNVVELKEKDEEDCCAAISLCSHSALISHLHCVIVEM